MKIIVIGATGTIGRAVVEALRGRHQVIPVSRSQKEHPADITDKSSLARAFAAIAKLTPSSVRPEVRCSSLSTR